jgi:16S rRNA (cytidine1402-2'-O)-methyltransferase
MAGKLVLCGTPIGNLEDLSPRAERVLREADVVACEDTRHTRKLLTHFGIRVRDLVSYNEANERRRAQDLVARVSAGEVVVVVSDAGMPGVSDPGYHVVRACIEEGLPVEVVPGPSAAVAALILSGLPPARFVFEGFLPRKASERRRHIGELAAERRTVVLYESPHRLAVCRELTKMHEEVRRGPLGVLASWARDHPPRGEVVVVVGGAVHDHREAPPPPELAARARSLMAAGADRKSAMQEVARASGVPKRDVFDALNDYPPE